MAKIDNNRGRPADAIEAADKALQLDPRNAYAYADRGFAYGTERKADLALQDLNSAIALNPNLIAARMIRAGILMDSDRDKADADYRFIEAAPLADPYYKRMAHLMLNMRNMPEKDIERELEALKAEASPAQGAQKPSVSGQERAVAAAEDSADDAPSLDEKQLGEDVFVYEGLVKLCAPDTSTNPADTDRVIHIFQARGGGDFALGARGAGDALLALGQGESGCSPKLQAELQARRSRIETALPAVLALRAAFRPKGCDFVVAFPGHSQIRTLSLSNGITYPQAELIFGGKVFRAECIAAPMSRNDAANMQMAQAKADALQGAALKDVSDTVTELRGYKTVSGESAAYVTRVYRGPTSTLTVLVAAKSAEIPMAVKLFREVSEIK